MAADNLALPVLLLAYPGLCACACECVCERRRDCVCPLREGECQESCIMGRNEGCGMEKMFGIHILAQLGVVRSSLWGAGWHTSTFEDTDGLTLETKIFLVFYIPAGLSWTNVSPELDGLWCFTVLVLWQAAEFSQHEQHNHRIPIPKPHSFLVL